MQVKTFLQIVKGKNAGNSDDVWDFLSLIRKKDRSF